MSGQVNARGVIRVETRGNQVVLNVFGTYAYLGIGAADDLIDALDEAVEKAAEESMK